jgi:hypothetical protein
VLDTAMAMVATAAHMPVIWNKRDLVMMFPFGE